jgi:parallel beta-helix repeat protein
MRSKVLILSFFIGILYNTDIYAQSSRLVNNQCGESVILGEPIFAEPVDSVDVYEFKFFTDDTSVNRTITSATSALEFKFYSGLPEYIDLKVCIRTKRDNTWSAYGDTCSFVIVSDCSFNKRFRENIDTEEKMLKLQSDLQDIIDLALTIDLSQTQEITIPVVFHIIVPASYTGNPYEYLPPAKINEAIQILNELYEGVRSNQPEAADCKINFCPAMNYELNSSTMKNLSCQHLGITYYGITYNTLGITDVNLPTGFPYFMSDFDPNTYVIPYQTYFPDNRYLNFFIFDDLSDYSAVGYASSETFGSNINYVVLERSIVGTNSTITRYEGYTVGHEAGHYFGLDHTWGGAYSTNSCGDGDFIDDTPAHASQNLSCDELSNTCTVEPFNDPVHNLMNYSSDGCRNHLTQGQAEWMHAVQQLFYPELPYTDAVSEGYDIYCQTIPSIEGASIEGPAEMIRCTGEATIAIYVNDASTFNLDIVDNATNTVIDAFDNTDFTACGSNYCINYNFDTEGVYRIELTVVASATYSQTTIRNYIIQECDSLANNLERAHWHFDHMANLDFSSGIGQLGQTAISAIPAEVSVCSETGDLLFYTNGHDIWNRDHDLQSISLDGNFEASKGIIALDFGLNAGVHNYMMVYLDVNLNLYYRFIAIDASYNISFTSTHQQLITSADLIANGINFASLSAMGVSASPKPDLTGYWLLSSLKDNVTSSYYPVAIEINYNSPYVGGDINISTFNTLTPATYPDDEFETTIKMSPDAKYLIYSVPYSENKFYIFNAQTGEINDQVICSFNNYFNKFFEVAFSKDSKFMYMTEIFQPFSSTDTMDMFYRIKQVDLDDIDMCDCQLYGKTIFEKNSAIDLTYNKNMFFLQEGPDDRIYFSRQSDIEDNAKYMGIIMYPENPATYSSTDNECGTYGDFIHYPSNEWIKNDLYLPNFVDAKPDSCDLDFRVCSANCNELSVLNLSHGFDSTFTWNFDNGINNYNYTGYTPQDIDTLAYSDLWIITLSKLGCTDTLSQEISFNGFTVNIEGNDTICNDSILYYYNCGTGFNSISWSVNGLPFSTQSELELLGSNYTPGSTVTIIANVTNQYGCLAVDTFYVYISGFEYELISSLDCTNTVPGEVQINISGQNGINYTSTIDGFNYIVANGPNSPYYGLFPGIHSYSVSDYYCNYTGNFNTAENLLVDSISVSTQCPGDTSDIIVWFTGGAAPYVINGFGTSVNTNENHFLVTDVLPGNYSITITDDFGCILDTVITVSTNSPIVQIFQSGENYCSNDNNVSLIAVTNGGLPSYQYQWGEYQNPISFFGTENMLSNLISFPEAIYVTVTDANGCTAIDSILIPSIISAAILDIDVTLPCGSIAGSMDLTITSANTITDFFWVIPDGIGGVDTVENEEDLDLLTNEGIYRVFATDEFGCEYVGMATLNTYDEPIVTQPMCSWDESLGTISTNWDMPVDHGYYDAWNWLINESNDSIPELNGSFDTLPPGTYILHHTDEAGCIMIDTIDIVNLKPMHYALETELSSDSNGNAQFTITVTVYGESLPYTYYPNQSYPIINNCTGIDFEVINNTSLPAVYQLSGLLSQCDIENSPFFNLCSSTSPGSPTGFPCDCLEIHFMDSLPNYQDTIHLDTIIKPTKCLAAGYGTGSVEFFDISTDLNIFPVFFLNTSTNETLVWNGDPDATVNFEDFGTGTFTINYWNAFSEVNSIIVTIEDAWDVVLSGTYSGLWNSYINQAIAVENLSLAQNAYMSFTNCTIYTATDTYSNISETEWTVATGAKIAINNTTIQSGCPQKWKGITVQGNQYGNQDSATVIIKGLYYPSQGFVSISNNSLIRDAQYAVYLQSGAVVNASNSNFLNNYFSIYINPYGYSFKPNRFNRSRINANTFTIDSFLYPTSLTGTDITTENGVQVRLNSISGINILGNNFDYQLNSFVRYRNAGIMSTNSKFTIDDYLTYESSFSKFYYGLRADGTSSALHFLSVSNSEFIGNKYGIKCGNLLAPKIIVNSFDDANYHSDETGIYFSECDQYTVEQNEFFDIEYGAYIRNSGVNYNKLYNNDFDGVKYPAVANLVNSDFVYGGNPGETGLEIKCNDFDYFDYAISVTGNMQRNQGAPSSGYSALAGNRFYNSNSSGIGEQEFCVSAGIAQSMNIPVYYYYHQDDDDCEPDKHTLIKVSPSAPYNNIQYDEAHCPDNYPPGTKTKSTDIFTIDEIILISDSIGMLISDKEFELAQIVDDGNTLMLHAKASMMNDANFAETIIELDQNGLISDMVIIELMQNTQAPQAAKATALINNSPLPQAGKDGIDAMTDVDETLRYILKQYQNGINARELKESEIIQLKQQRSNLIPELINIVLVAESEAVTDRAVQYLKDMGGVSNSKFALVLTTANQNYHDAEIILTSLWSDAQNLSIEQKVDLENYVLLQSVALQTEKNIMDFDSIVIANQAFLLQMAQDTLTSGCEQAQLMLEMAGVASWDPVVYPPFVSNQKNIISEDNRNNVFKDYIKIYPNPAKENIFVEYALIDFDENSKNTIEIISQTGQIIAFVNINQPVGIVTINIHNFTPGNYFARLNNSVIKFSKM